MMKKLLLLLMLLFAAPTYPRTYPINYCTIDINQNGKPDANELISNCNYQFKIETDSITKIEFTTEEKTTISEHKDLNYEYIGDDAIIATNKSGKLQFLLAKVDKEWMVIIYNLDITK